jgi:hypothetical protein
MEEASCSRFRSTSSADSFLLFLFHAISCSLAPTPHGGPRRRFRRRRRGVSRHDRDAKRVVELLGCPPTWRHRPRHRGRGQTVVVGKWVAKPAQRFRFRWGAMSSTTRGALLAHHGGHQVGNRARGGRVQRVGRPAKRVHDGGLRGAARANERTQAGTKVAVVSQICWVLQRNEKTKKLLMRFNQAS